MKQNLKMMLNIVLVLSFYSCAICFIMVFNGQYDIKNIVTLMVSFILFIVTLLVKNRRVHLRILVNFIYFYMVCDIVTFFVSIKRTTLIEKCLMLAVITLTFILAKYLKRESKLY